jgi:hypothetical protein
VPQRCRRLQSLLRPLEIDTARRQPTAAVAALAAAGCAAAVRRCGQRMRAGAVHNVVLSDEDCHVQTKAE